MAPSHGFSGGGGFLLGYLGTDSHSRVALICSENPNIDIQSIEERVSSGGPPELLYPRPDIHNLFPPSYGT